MTTTEAMMDYKASLIEAAKAVIENGPGNTAETFAYDAALRFLRLQFLDEVKAKEAVQAVFATAPAVPLATPVDETKVGACPGSGCRDAGGYLGRDDDEEGPDDPDSTPLLILDDPEADLLGRVGMSAERVAACKGGEHAFGLDGRCEFCRLDIRTTPEWDKELEL